MLICKPNRSLCLDPQIRLRPSARPHSRIRNPPGPLRQLTGSSVAAAFGDENLKPGVEDGFEGFSVESSSIPAEDALRYKTSQ